MPGIAGNFEKFLMKAKGKVKKAEPQKGKAKGKLPRGKGLKGGKIAQADSGAMSGLY